MSHSISNKDEITKKKKLIIEKSQALGFDVIGFANPKLPKSVKKNLDSFLKSNFHGEMDWLAKNKHRRESPENLWSDVKTVISLGSNYGPHKNPLENLINKDYGNISVYARGEDYHKIIKKNLKKFGGWLAKELNCNLKVFVDTAPIMEKNIAEIAGIGWQGKHSNIVSKNYGSWLFLSEIFLDIFISEDIEDVSSEEDLQDKQEEITGMNDETNSDDEDNEDKSSEEDVKVEEKQKEIEESSSSEEIEDVGMDESNNVDKDIVDTSSSEEEEDEVDYPKVTVEEDGSNLSEEENEDPESNHTEEEEEEDRMRDATILQMLSQREDIFTDDKIEEEEGEMEEYEEEDEDNKRVEIDLSDESSTNSDDSNDESSRNIRKVANRSHFGSRHPARYTKDNVSSSSDENLSGSEELEESSIGSESDEGESSRRSFLKKRRYSEFASSDSDEQVYSGSSLRLAPNPKKMKLEWSDSDSSIYSSSPEEPVDDDPVIILDSSDEDEPIAEVSSENEEDNESETTEGKELVSISEMEKEESKDEPISEEYLLRQKYLEDREAIKQFWIEEIKRIGLFLLQELEQFSIDDANVLRNSMESFEEIEHYTNNILERNIRLILYLLVRLIRIRLHNPTAFVPAAKRKLIVSIQSYQDEIYILQRILQREQIPNENTFKQIAYQELLNSQELLEKYRENNRGPQAFAIHPLSLGDLVKK